MLTTYTESDLRQQAAEELARRIAAAAAERKAWADALRLGFHLTGSASQADELAALGQRDLFRDL